MLSFGPFQCSNNTIEGCGVGKGLPLLNASEGLEPDTGASGEIGLSQTRAAPITDQLSRDGRLGEFHGGHIAGGVKAREGRAGEVREFPS
jgi:hypothetical protein